MTAVKQVRRLLATRKTARKGPERELRRVLDEDTAQVVSEDPGHMAAGEALTTFRLRADSLALAGVASEGLDAVLSRLAGIDPGDQVALFHFKSADRHYLVFVHDEVLLGVAAFPRRDVTRAAFIAW